MNSFLNNNSNSLGNMIKLLINLNFKNQTDFAKKILSNNTSVSKLTRIGSPSEISDTMLFRLYYYLSNEIKYNYISDNLIPEYRETYKLQLELYKIILEEINLRAAKELENPTGRRKK